MEQKLNLYKVSVEDYNYDDYDSFVVAAYTEDEAKELSSDLPGSKESYKIECIGLSNAVAPCIVLGSYNAG